MPHRSLYRGVPALIVAGGLALLAACSGTQTAPTAASTGAVTTTQPAPAATGTASGDPATSGASTTAAAAGAYLDYATYEAHRADYHGKQVVLFFHANWCPSCQATDRNLTADPAAIPADLVVVKVDYDTATSLKRQYGVTTQHTFVAIGADGAKLKAWTGSPTAADIASHL